MTETQPAIMLRTRGLTKRYGSQVALQGLSFSVEAGQFVALLGPNGAGKSTLFQVLTGLFAADEGEVQVAGHALSRAAPQALRHIGVVFQQVSLDLDLSVRRNLLFQADLHGLPRKLAAARIEVGSARLGIAATLDRKARELSGGNRRKVELARALLHAPSVLLMDKPPLGWIPNRARTCCAPCAATCRSVGSACCGRRIGWKKRSARIACWCCTRGRCWPTARRRR